MTEKASQALRALAGSHRAYYLPASGLMLALETIPGTDEGYRGERALARAVDYPTVLAALANAHRFNLAWLPDNRAGRFAPRQLLVPLRAHLRGLGVVAPYTTLAIAGTDLAWKAGSTGARIAAFVGFALLVVLPAGLLIRQLLTVLAERRAGVVASAAGAVRFVLEPGRPPRYFYQIGERRLPVVEATADALIQGLIYRVYFTPVTGVLVGIEPVEAGTAES